MHQSDPRKAFTIGRYIWEERHSQRLSARELARRVAVSDSTILRIERDEIMPKPRLLRALAEQLNLAVADAFERAGYAIPDDLPTFRPYMRAKYRDLPDSALRELERSFARLAEKHGLRGPVNREDER